MGSALSTTYSVFGHVCGDYSTPVIRLSRREAEQSQNCVLGIEGLRRGTLMNAKQLMHNTGHTIQQVAGSMGWNMDKLDFSKGGPAASAALAIFQLDPIGHVSFRGVIGEDAIGDKVIDYFRRYQMPTDSLIRIPGVQTSHTLVINERIEGDPEAHRTFIHDEGANAVIRFGDIPEYALDLPKTGRNIVMVGGNWLMPNLNPNGILKIMEIAKGKGALTILNTVHDPSGLWDLGMNAPRLVDLLITDKDEAIGISGVDVDRLSSLPKDEYPYAVELGLLSWFKENGFRNVVITDGIKGSYMYATGSPRIFADHLDTPIHLFARDYVVTMDRPKYGLGAGDCTAGGFAVGVGESLYPIQAGILAMSAGGACALQIAGEIGEPVVQGGHRSFVNKIASDTYTIAGKQQIQKGWLPISDRF